MSIRFILAHWVSKGQGQYRTLSDRSAYSYSGKELIRMNQTHHAETYKIVVQLDILLKQVLAQARTIRDWNWYDLLGGNMMISWDKRKQIRALSQHLEKLQTSLLEVHDETALEASLSKQDYLAIWQPWIEKEMTDFKIHQEISGLVDNLEDLEKKLSDLTNLKDEN